MWHLQQQCGQCRLWWASLMAGGNCRARNPLTAACPSGHAPGSSMLHLGLVLGGSPALCLPLQQDRSVLTSNQGHPPNCICSTDQQGGGLPRSCFSRARTLQAAQEKPSHSHPLGSCGLPRDTGGGPKNKNCTRLCAENGAKCRTPFLGVRMVCISHL